MCRSSKDDCVCFTAALMTSSSSTDSGKAILEQEVREIKGQRLSPSTLPVPFATGPSEAYEQPNASSPNASSVTSESVRVPDFKISPMLCRQCVQSFFVDYEVCLYSFCNMHSSYHAL